MHFERKVPLMPAFREATKNFTEYVDQNDPFLIWFKETETSSGSSVGAGIFLTLEETPNLINTVPKNAAGQRWADKMVEVLEDTKTRNFTIHDGLYVDENEKQIVEDFDAFCDTFMAVSPFLSVIEEPVVTQIPGYNTYTPFTVAELKQERAKIIDAGIIVGSDGRCDRHEESCYGDTRQTAPWEHIHFFYPKFREELTTLVNRFDDELRKMSPGII